MTEPIQTWAKKTCFGLVQSCLGGGRRSPQPEEPNCNVGWSSRTGTLQRRR